MSSYGALADWYDSLTEDVDYEGLFDYLNAIMKRRGLRPRRVLDMACGTGSLSYLFAEHGYETIGVDLSEDMLVRAAAKAGETSNQPIFYHGNMNSFVLQPKVDLLVCMLDSFNYMDTPQQGRAAIKCFSRTVADQGLLVFDVRPPEQLRAFDGQMFMDETEDVVCIWRTEFDETENQCFYGMDIFVREGNLWRREQEEHLEYAFELSWIQKELEAAGFSEIEIFGDRTFLSPAPGEERVYIVARKKDNGNE